MPNTNDRSTSSADIPRRDVRGITMVELLITAALLAIMVAAIVPVFSVSQRGLTSSEAHTTMKNQGQKAVNRIQNGLVQNKRLFENVAADTAFLARVQLSGAPAALAGSKLPTLEENGSLSVSSGTFVSTSVGNSLFFAGNDAPRDYVVTDAGGSTVPVRIDVYHFTYYYLAPDAAVTLGGKPRRDLWEWKSVPYADHQQLVNITDVTKRANTAAALQADGVAYAWDPAQTSVNSAFYTLSGGGAIAAAAAHTLPKSVAKKVVDIKAGVTIGGFKWGVSPNSSGSFQPSQAVPVFTTAATDFPSGFEVVTVGPNSARQVFVRLVLAAQGSFKGVISHEQVVLANSRDLW
jgi:type II secretory pathway pseudopilin PulG